MSTANVLMTLSHSSELSSNNDRNRNLQTRKGSLTHLYWIYLNDSMCIEVELLFW